MILNVILGVLAIGWAINTAVFQARGNRAMWVLNAVLCLAATVALMVRLS